LAHRLKLLLSYTKSSLPRPGHSQHLGPTTTLSTLESYATCEPSFQEPVRCVLAKASSFSGASIATAVTWGAIRRTSFVRTWPEPNSMSVSHPSATSLFTHGTHCTGLVICSTSSWRISVPWVRILPETLATRGVT